METEKTIGLISAIREKANKRIVGYLQREGITDLAPSHGVILVMLYQYDTMAMSELAKRVNRDNSTITTLVDKLVKTGYVRKIKNQDDRRITNISLTQKGRDFQPVFDNISSELISKIYEGFSDLEKELLVRLLEKLFKNC